MKAESPTAKRKRNGKTEPFKVRLAKDVLIQLRAMAAREDRDVSYLVRKAVDEMLAR